MVYTNYTHKEYFRRLAHPHEARVSDVRYIGLGLMPWDDLPTLRRSLPATSTVHAEHLLLLSRFQARRLPHYVIRIQGSPRRFHCYPKNGYLALPLSACRVVYAYRELVWACETHDDRRWQRLCYLLNNGHTLPGPLPALWDVHLTASNATTSRVVEYISHVTNCRLYAVLESLAVWDTEHALFRARILGAGHHGLHCLVRVPFDFLDPSHLRDDAAKRTHDLEWLTQELLRHIVEQPDVCVLPTASASVALLPARTRLHPVVGAQVKRDYLQPSLRVRLGRGGKLLRQTKKLEPTIEISVKTVTEFDAVVHDDARTLDGGEAMSLVETLVEDSDSE